MRLQRALVLSVLLAAFLIGFGVAMCSSTPSLPEPTPSVTPIPGDWVPGVPIAIILEEKENSR